MAIRTAILTISDLCSQGKREDTSGKTIEDMLPDGTFEVCQKEIIPDDYETITKTLRRFSDELKAQIAGIDLDYQKAKLDRKQSKKIKNS